MFELIKFEFAIVSLNAFIAGGKTLRIFCRRLQGSCNFLKQPPSSFGFDAGGFFCGKSPGFFRCTFFLNPPFFRGSLCLNPPLFGSTLFLNPALFRGSFFLNPPLFFLYPAFFGGTFFLYPAFFGGAFFLNPFFFFSEFFQYKVNHSLYLAALGSIRFH